ncbi:MAG: cation transporter [Candidatus Altiarchaeota archaeon]|nr:cation transporter [Candidatus Altiarchaeota archaeon]
MSIGLGAASNSISLVGFGLDSFIESLSGFVMIWRFGSHKNLTHKEEEKIEEKATKIIGYTFYILAFYILFESIKKLYLGKPTTPTFFGMIITGVSLIVMPYLYLEKQKISKKINRKSLEADSKQTLACMSLSLAVLIGLVANYLFGFWQADPLAGILISFILIREGYFTIRDAKLCGC